MSRRYPAIPVVGETLGEIVPAVRAMKDSVEQLTGQHQTTGVGAPVMHVQDIEPRDRGHFARGDLWIKPQENTMFWWTGTNWKQLVLA